MSGLSCGIVINRRLVILKMFCVSLSSFFKRYFCYDDAIYFQINIRNISCRTYIRPSNGENLKKS